MVDFAPGFRPFDPVRDEPITPAQAEAVAAALVEYTQLEQRAQNAPYYATVMECIREKVMADDPKLIDFHCTLSAEMLTRIIGCASPESARRIAEDVCIEIAAMKSAPDVPDPDLL